MAEYNLIATPALGGFTAEQNGVAVREIADRSVVSFACNSSGFEPLFGAIETAFGTALPGPGKSATAPAPNITLISTGLDQWFAIFDDDHGSALEFISAATGAHAAITDQSDGWAMLQLSGPRARQALERICPINLHPDAFARGSVARTVMEHLGVIIFNPHDGDVFELMAPRSSAQSFLHAVMTSVQNLR